MTVLHMLAVAPFPIEADLGKWLAYGLYLIIGILFGAALEQSGFAYSPNLAAQFYLKDMRVLKVMFTAIITAMTLIFLTSGMGLLDYRDLFVDPTYLWPGIVGGIIMGVGFVIGGFCPGTSATAAATGSIDALFYLGGLMTGIFAFGETVDSFAEFWYGWAMGRFTLPEWLGLSTGATVLLVIVVALIFFWAAEWFEEKFGGIDRKSLPKWRLAGAGAFLAVAFIVVLIGQPGWQTHYQWIENDANAQLANREVQIHPAELLEIMHKDKVFKLVMLDVRPETEYNLFHIKWARHVDDDPTTLVRVADELNEPVDPTAVVVMSDGESRATEAWKVLVAEDVPNVYILEGGINNWLTLFGGREVEEATFVAGEDQPRFVFAKALGDRYTASNPDRELVEEFEFTPKVKVAASSGPKAGGCG